MTSPLDRSSAGLPIDLETAGVDDAQAAMGSGATTAEQLVLAYLDRIARFDAVGAVRCVAPEAVQQARDLDAERAATGSRGPLHGVPVLVKDNIDVAGLPTTAGAIALDGNVVVADAPLVRRVRAAGAVILGKTNLTELANFMARDMPSGYSSLGGQVLNPYDLTITPCGSSSGSGAAAALGLATLTVGTETNGSILCPASMQGVVGVKPTVGLISRTGIVPIAPSQDTAGPMTRTVRDAAALLTAMAGYAAMADDTDDTDDIDDTDPALSAPGRPGPVDYVAELESVVLKGLRLAVPAVPADVHGADLELFEQAQRTLAAAGVVLVPTPQLVETSDVPVLLHEFGPAITAYLTAASGARVHNLAELVAWNSAHAGVALKYGQTLLEEALAIDHDGDRLAYERLRARDRAVAGEHGIDAVVRAYDVAALLVPGATASGVGARAGYPSVTVTAGVRAHGRRPFGVTVLGPAWTEALLLGVAYRYEQLARARVLVSQANPALFADRAGR